MCVLRHKNTVIASGEKDTQTNNHPIKVWLLCKYNISPTISGSVFSFEGYLPSFVPRLSLSAHNFNV